MTISREELEKLGEVRPYRLTPEERKEHKKESQRRDEIKHKKERKEHRKEWREKHKEEKKEYDKPYNKNRKEEKAAYMKGYSKKRKERQLFLGGFGEEGFSINLKQTVNKDGKVYGVGSFTNIRTSEENRFNFAKCKNNDAIFLNEYFEGCELHHLAEDIVAFIPKKLHKSIWHNLRTGKNMDLINKAALEFIEEQKLQC